MLQVIKYIRSLSIYDNNRVLLSQYQTPYTRRERLQDLLRISDRGAFYDKSLKAWVVRYPDQTHVYRYHKLKYI